MTESPQSLRDMLRALPSFPAELPPGVALPLIGDLAICAPVVLREAAEQAKRPPFLRFHCFVFNIDT